MIRAQELLSRLTPEQKKQISQSAKVTAAKLNYRDYCEYTHRGAWKPYKHLIPVCDALQDIVDGKLDRLMIFMPPRHGKSMTVTETFPSYFLGKYPDKRVIEVSYGEDLAERFGYKNKQKIAEFGDELFGVAINRSNSSKTSWGIEGHDGGMRSVGIGGSLTGHGADLMIIDDPIKNQKDASSQLIRDRIGDEWQYSLATRLQPGKSAVILILTRWNDDDLAGRILKSEEGSRWKVISLPAIAEEDNDLIGREYGQALCPELYPKETLEEIKSTVGSAAFAALYQQRPTIEGGNIFKDDWWQFYGGLNDLPRYFEIQIQSWDCAFKGEETSDFVVGQVWGRIKNDYYLIDQVRKRMGFSDTVKEIRKMSLKHPDTLTKLIEDKANGTAIIEILQRDLVGVTPVNPEGGKISRAQGISPIVESGHVFIPSPVICPWVVDYLDECRGFPKMKHDDQVDATSQALTYLYTKYQADLKAILDLNKLGVFSSGFKDTTFGY